MNRYKIAIGCDHTAILLKNKIIDFLKSQGHDICDFGTNDNESTHYPIFGRRVAINVVKKNFDYGIVICGTGIGISNAANKVKYARCILASELIQVKLARENYDANILAIGERVNGYGRIIDLIKVFLNTKYLNKNDNNINLINQKISKLIDRDDLFNDIANNSKK
ncbi:MAG: RpiB/LacA/LacB family sugar-phosphate isomerase [Mycoplasmoidaceae bacterium]